MCVVLASINSMVVSMTIGAACLFKFQLPVQFGYALMVSYAVFCLLAVTVVQRSPKFYECTTWGVFDGHIDKPACH